MKPHHQDLEAAPSFLIHEAATPELIRQIYSENQLPIENPVVNFLKFVKKWLISW